jgi:hypothetical protein
VYRQTQVPLEVTCYTDAQIDGRETHTISRQQAAWLRDQREKYPHNIIGADFVFALGNARVGESFGGLHELDEYIARTRHLLKKSWMQGYYPRSHDLLGLTLGVPHVAGRRALDTLQEDALLGTRTLLPSMEKGAITHAALEFYGGDTKISELYSDLHVDACRYQELLAQTSQLREAEYEQLIAQTLDEDVPKAIELLRRIQ